MVEDAGVSSEEASSDRPRKSVYGSLVEIATELLNADCCEYLVEEADRLVVRQSSEAGPEDGPASYHLILDIPGSVYSSGTPCVIDDALDTRSTSSATTGTNEEYRSLCCVPVGEDGLLLAKAVRPAAFDKRDLDLLGDLVALVQETPLGAKTPTKPLSDGGRWNRRDRSQQLEEVADILSHDLKNPLNVVQGNIDLALQAGEDQYLENAIAALHRIEELIDEVVFLARTGQLVEQTEVVNLKERAEVAWENVQTKDATLEVTGSIEFIASKRGVCHLLENLIENAVRHAGPNVTIRIGPTQSGFYVEDDGPGIPADHWDEVFIRGFSLGGSTSGLGLHIVRRIVEAHGWHIHVGESEEGGARFDIDVKELL